MANNSSHVKPCRHKVGEQWEPGCCGDDAIAPQPSGSQIEKPPAKESESNR